METKKKTEEVVEETPQATPKMEIPVDSLQTIMDKLENLEKANEVKDAEIAALQSIASQTRLQEATEKQGVDSRPRVHFKVLDGKVVIGWPEKAGEEKKSEIIFNPTTNSPVGEILKSVYYFLDGTKSELIDQIKFTRSTDQVFARVIEQDGDYGLLEFEDKSLTKEPIRVHKKFWNA